MPGRSGEPVVTNSYAYFSFCMRGCGCTRRPVFPVPSFPRARNFLANLGQTMSRVRGVLPRHHCERSEAIQLPSRVETTVYCVEAMDCFAEPVIGRAFA